MYFVNFKMNLNCASTPVLSRQNSLGVYLDHAEPHILVCRETMQHEDGRFVSWSAPEGITELIVLMVHIADLHTQCPPPVPMVKKGKTQACSGSDFGRSTGLL